MLVRLVQLRNALFPIVPTPLGMMMLVRLVQPSKALYSIVVKLVGRVTL